MEIKVKVFANLRDLVPVKPILGEAIIVDIKENATILDVMEKINLKDDDVAIVMIGGVHHPKDFKLVKPTSISLFSPVGGG